MISKKSSLHIVLFTFVFFGLVVTSEATTANKTKKNKAKATATADQGSQYKLTPEEKKTVEEAQKEFDKAKGQPKPSKNLQDKMQSGM